MFRKLLAPPVLALALALPTLAAADDPRPLGPTAQERLEALIDRLFDRLEPGFEALEDMLGDLRGWHAPEILPNGDILIRRRTQPFGAPDDPPVDRRDDVPDDLPEAPEDAEPPVTEPLEL